MSDDISVPRSTSQTVLTNGDESDIDRKEQEHFLRVIEAFKAYR